MDTLPKVPVRPNSKSPTLRHWNQLSKHELQNIDIHEGYNIAIRCDDIVVVDIDNKPKNENVATLDMQDTAARVFKCDTFVVKSKSRNPHAYFKLDNRMKHWKRRTGVYGFIDILTGTSSLAIAPGSIVDGKIYTVFNDTDISIMPNWLFKLLDSQMVLLNEQDKKRIPKDTQDITEGYDDILDYLHNAGYNDIGLSSNIYGGYDIVYGYPHTCCITGMDHDSIDGFVFKTSSGGILAGCYSQKCRGKYKELTPDTQESLQDVIDRAVSGSHFDIALATKKILKNTFKYVDDKIWYVWNPKSGLWYEDRGGKQIRLEISTIVCSAFMKRSIDWSNLARETDDENVRIYNYGKSINLLKVAERLKNSNFKGNIIKECETVMCDRTFLEYLDENTSMIGFNDGVYDCEAKTFRKGQPEDCVSLTVGYNFPQNIPEDIKTKVKNVFEAFFNNTDETKYFLQTLASCIDGKRRFQEYYIWTGKASNGKSTCQQLLIKTFGDYAKPLDINFWTKPKRECGTPLPELADKKGVRFIFSNEPEASDKIQVAKIKEATGGESITSRKLFLHPITYRPQFGIFILCNDLPDLSKCDGGIERRTRVIPFLNTFNSQPLKGQRQADPDIIENCRNNIEWRKACISTLIDVYHTIEDLKCLQLPKIVQEASKRYLEDSNPIGKWLRDNYEVTNNEEDKIPSSTLYAMYRHDVNEYISQTIFNRELVEKMNISKKKMRYHEVPTMCFYGVKALDKQDEGDSDKETGNK